MILTSNSVEDSAPLITVVVPMYKADKTLSETLGTIHGQTLKNIEILCVDDASPDGCADIVRSRMAQDNRYRLVVNEVNLGLAGTRNRAIDAAKGKYIYFIDADDSLPHDDCLELLYATAEKDNADEVWGRTFFWYSDTNEAFEGYYALCQKEELHATTLLDSPYFVDNVIACNKLLRKSFLDKYNIRFNELLRCNEDVLFSVMVHTRARSISCILKPTYLHRQYRETEGHVSLGAVRPETLLWKMRVAKELVLFFSTVSNKKIVSLYSGFLNWMLYSSLFLFCNKPYDESSKIEVAGHVAFLFEHFPASVTFLYLTKEETCLPPTEFFDLVMGRMCGCYSKRIWYTPNYCNSNTYQLAMYWGNPSSIGDNPFTDGVPAALADLKEHPGSKPILHLHWIDEFFKKARGAEQPEAAMRAASAQTLARIDEYKALGGRVVWTVHDIIMHDSDYADLQYDFMRNLANAVDVIHLNCHFIPKELQSILRPQASKICVAPHGNYAEHSISKVSSSAEARKVLGLPAHGLIYLHFGVLGRYKGTRKLLQDFQALGRSDVTLCIVGSMPDPTSENARIIRDVVSNNDNIILDEGFVDDSKLAAYIEACDVVVLPYVRIYNSGSTMLALTHGRPVIAPRMGALPEVLGPSSPELLYDPTDDNALLAVLQRFCSCTAAHRRKLMQDALARGKDFPWAASRALLHEAYGDLLFDQCNVSGGWYLGATLQPQESPELATIVCVDGALQTILLGLRKLQATTQGRARVHVVVRSMQLLTVSVLRSVFPQWFFWQANGQDNGRLCFESAQRHMLEEGAQAVLFCEQGSVLEPQALDQALRLAQGNPLTGAFVWRSKLSGISAPDVRYTLCPKIAAVLIPTEALRKSESLVQLDVLAQWVEKARERGVACTSMPGSLAVMPMLKGATDKGSRRHYAFPLKRKKQILVDVSFMAKHSGMSGMQRVAGNILANLRRNPPEGYVVHPVYAEDGGKYYRYAASQLVRDVYADPAATDGSPRKGTPVSLFRGDVLLAGLDWVMPEEVALAPYLRGMRKKGVRIYSVVHDLVPLQLPHTCSRLALDVFPRWLRLISEFDGAACVSRATAQALSGWLKKQTPQNKKFSVGWFHLGADLCPMAGHSDLPENAEEILKHVAEITSILVVGTLEPRKRHQQILAAFEKLWAEGSELSLVLVGQEGWGVESLVQRLKSHPQLGKKLIWVQNATDAFLQCLYISSVACLMASEGEGFGLPVVESARWGKHLILRNLPVFREIAGDRAFYFDGMSDDDLADALREWTRSYETGLAPSSEGIVTNDWVSSTRMLLDALPVFAANNKRARKIKSKG